MPTRGQLKALLPTAADLKAELMKKSMDGYINAEKMISPHKFGDTGPELAKARQHILNVTLTPENRALIEKIKTTPGVWGAETRLKDQLKAVTENRDLGLEAAQRVSDRMYVNRGLATGGRASRKTRKSKKTKSRKTRSRISRRA